MYHLAKATAWVLLGATLVSGCAKSRPPQSRSSSPEPVASALIPEATASPLPGQFGGSSPGSPGSGGISTSGQTQGTPTPSASPSDSPPPEVSPRPPEPPIRRGLARMPGYQASLLKVSPPVGNSDGVARGYGYYARFCIMCHGSDLKGAGVSHGRRPVNLRDLSDPAGYKYGMTDQAVYRTILYGVPRSPMGNYESVMKEDQVWDIIAFLKTRWRIRKS